MPRKFAHSRSSWRHRHAGPFGDVLQVERIFEVFRYQGILGNAFTGLLVDQARIDTHEAVVPTISGKAWISGLNTLVLDHDDPFPEGYVIGDIWG